MHLTSAKQTWEQVIVTCARPRIAPPQFVCPDARISGQLGTLGKQNIRASVAYHSVRGTLNFNLRNLKLAGGGASVNGRLQGEEWHARVEANRMDLKALRTLAAPWFELPAEFSVEGRGSLRATVLGAAALQSADVKLSVEALTANNAEGTIATDALSFEIDAKLRPDPKDWTVDADIRSATGQAYSDPIFVDLGANPLSARLHGFWNFQHNTLAIQSLEVDQTGIARMALSGELGFSQPPYARELRIDLQSLQFPGAYTVLMQPFLLDSDFKELTTSGRITGSVIVTAGAPTALDLQIEDVTAQDKAGKLGIEGLGGRLVWAHEQTSDTTPSRITWKAAHAYGLSGSGAQLDFLASGKNLTLLQPTRIPVLDGGLFIRTLRVQDFGADDMSLRFEGELQPIGMSLLSKAFGWPEFSGTLAGKIPEVSYDNGVISVGGALEAQVFDGLLRVEELELRDALGTYPRLKADVTLRNLDLQAVTGTFSFGTITGRLDGDIDNLELFRWHPVRMDARLYTPQGDKSRHLISQRAVKNLSSIGGGGGSVAAALQSGFLRFFENFRYSRLGLSCRLANEVCRMDGIERAAGEAYYIVKGSGIPRIDIIGNARLVDWPRLVEQLKAVTESEGPVVQ